MRHLLFAALCCVCFSCDAADPSKNNRWLSKAYYDGHSYIVYSGRHQGGLVHDPDCEKCENKNKAERLNNS